MSAVFSLMTFNVHEAVGSDHHQNYYRIIQVIKEVNPDLLMLQEVDLNRDENNQDVSFLFETIEKSSAYVGIKGITMFRSRSAYGNAMFLKYRPENIKRHDISYAGCEPRGVIECTCRIKGHPVRLLSTHLGLRKKERAQQVLELKQLLKQEQNLPTLLAGDFNEWRPFSKRLRGIKEEMNLIPARPTFPAFFPLVALDRIFYRGNIEHEKIIVYRSPLYRMASDHLPLIAGFNLT